MGTMIHMGVGKEWAGQFFPQVKKKLTGKKTHYHTGNTGFTSCTLTLLVQTPAGGNLPLYILCPEPKSKPKNPEGRQPRLQR